MANWLIYLKERFPLPVYVLLVGGIACSGSLIASGKLEALGFAFAFVGIFCFFGVLRLMDELKDYEKDVIVHPERPLPRGILKTDQVEKLIHRLVMSMVVFALVVGGVASWVAGLNYLVITIWLWLMYKEFYLGSWLVDRPLLYAISHQLILLPICSFAVVVHDASLLSATATWYYGLAVLGAFFSYEVCRKLDPKAHPLLKTYLTVYGAKLTVVFVFVLNLIAAYAAVHLGLRWWLWPFEALTVLSLVVLFVAPAKYKLAEGAATLSLLFHIWGVSFAYFAYTFGIGI